MNAINRTLTYKPTQREQADTRQVKNNAGGFVYAITDEQRLRRFLVLGTDGGTYYQSERAITKENLVVAEQLVKTNPQAVYDALVWASTTAPRNEASLFVLAVLASGSPEARQFAKRAFPVVVRTATHLYHFVGYLRLIGKGWSRGLRTMVASYFDRPADTVALHAVKYRQRDGWTMRDVLRLSHAKPLTAQHTEIFKFVTDKPVDVGAAPDVLRDYLSAKDATEAQVLDIVKSGRLPWEGLSDEQRTPAVWTAMLPNLPINALVRNLATLTRNGVLANKANVAIVVKKLTDAKQVKGSRIHPVQLTDALLVYKSGGSLGLSKGPGYTANPQIVAALETAIDLAFKNVEPTGKRLLVAMDVSGSMWGGVVGGSKLITPGLGGALMATQHSYEENVSYIAFSGEGGLGRYNAPNLRAVTKMDRNGMTSVSGAVDSMRALSHMMTSTDCALPMIYAQANKLDVDAFIVYTDNETWAGTVQPMHALRDYRKASGINSKLIVVGMTATNFTIGDPQDAGTLDVVGLSSDAPAVIASFIKGW